MEFRAMLPRPTTAYPIFLATAMNQTSPVLFLGSFALDSRA
jgi:hypothetical protein